MATQRAIREAVYLDTSVPSAYLDSRDRIRQKLTKNFWDKLANYRVFISNHVLDELNSIADQQLKIKARSLVEPFITLHTNSEVENLAGEYVKEGIVRPAYIMDALHIAVATVNNIDYLVSWNFKHMVNVRTRRLVALVNLKRGYKPIEIVAPVEL